MQNPHIKALSADGIGPNWLFEGRKRVLGSNLSPFLINFLSFLSLQKKEVILVNFLVQSSRNIQTSLEILLILIPFS